MKLIVATVFAYLAVLGFATPIENVDKDVRDWPEVFVQDTTSSKSSRITGGGIVNPPHAIQFQVGLLVTTGGSNFRRAGTLISNTRTLTCASCVVGSTSANARFGSHNFAAVDAGEIRHTILPANYRIHPSHNVPNNNQNNIAVLIHPHVTYTATIQPIPLATGGNQFAGIVATMSGWGRTATGADHSEQLRAASNFVLTNAACAEVYPNTVFAGLICVNTFVGGIQGGICPGDFGGPLFIGEGAGRSLIGIANFVHSSGCDAGQPAGFARITHHAAWIFSHM